MQPATYAIAIGSNRPGRHGWPEAEVRAAIASLEQPVANLSRWSSLPPPFLLPRRRTGSSWDGGGDGAQPASPASPEWTPSCAGEAREGLPLIARGSDSANAAPGTIVAVSRIFATPPLGPSSRRYANAVAILESAESPTTLLARLKNIERAFGRRSGRRWGARVIDLDIILWSGGVHVGPALTIPHPAFRSRRFVLDPLEALVPRWRDPVTGLTVRQLAARVRAVDRRPYRS